MYPIKVARRDKTDGKIHHEIDNQPDRIYRDIRAGISWPLNVKAEYFCIFAEKDQLNNFKKYPLIFLAEGENNNFQHLLRNLTDWMKMVLGEYFYADFEYDNGCFQDALISYLDDNNLKG